MNKELEIWQFIADRLSKGERVVLLVVATSSGSSPGRPGYKMAVAEDGELIGSVGGGVMEVNLVDGSRTLLSASPQAGEIATTSVQDQVHRKDAPNSSGMICSGKQTVIFKLLGRDKLERVKYAIDGVVNREGDVLLITDDVFAVGHPECPIENDITFSRESDHEFSYCERLGAKNDLYIIGGGHCALALSELMSKMDFHVSLFDDRPQLNTLEKNHFADDINVIDSYETITNHVDLNSRSFVVVMTLGYKSDKVVIRELINKDFRYFGVLGS